MAKYEIKNINKLTLNALDYNTYMNLKKNNKINKDEIYIVTPVAIDTSNFASVKNGCLKFGNVEIWVN